MKGGILKWTLPVLIVLLLASVVTGWMALDTLEDRVDRNARILKTMDNKTPDFAQFGKTRYYRQSGEGNEDWAVRVKKTQDDLKNGTNTLGGEYICTEIDCIKPPFDLCTWCPDSPPTQQCKDDHAAAVRAFRYSFCP